MAVEATIADGKSHAPVGGLGALMLGALGVVYGDIGTSPLYTLKTALEWAGGATPAVALGMLSLIIWTLLITTSIKYVAVVMRADNDGEGGILALMSLLGIKHGARMGVITIGILGAALLYGDGAITPAISVLSALEGLKIPAPEIAPYIVPLVGAGAGRPVRASIPGQRTDRKAVRPDHDVLVHHDRGARTPRHHEPSGRAGGPRSALWLSLSVGARLYRISRARRGVPVRDRRRGALCRHGSFRAAADPFRLVWPGAANCCCSIMPGRPRWWSMARSGRAAIRSSRCARRACRCRWWCWRRSQRSSPARRSSAARFR